MLSTVLNLELVILRNKIIELNAFERARGCIACCISRKAVEREVKASNKLFRSHIRWKKILVGDAFFRSS